MVNQIRESGNRGRQREMDGEQEKKREEAEEAACEGVRRRTREQATEGA